MNLEYLLRQYNDKIQIQYALFKSCLITCEGVDVGDLRSFVLELPAFANNSQPNLLHETRMHYVQWPRGATCIASCTLYIQRLSDQVATAYAGKNKSIVGCRVVGKRD